MLTALQPVLPPQICIAKTGKQPQGVWWEPPTLPHHATRPLKAGSKRGDGDPPQGTQSSWPTTHVPTLLRALTEPLPAPLREICHILYITMPLLSPVMMVRALLAAAGNCMAQVKHLWLLCFLHMWASPGGQQFCDSC